MAKKLKYEYPPIFRHGYGILFEPKAPGRVGCEVLACVMDGARFGSELHVRKAISLLSVSHEKNVHGKDGKLSHQTMCVPTEKAQVAIEQLRTLLSDIELNPPTDND